MVMGNNNQEYKEYLKGALYNHAILWLFLPESLFYEKAQVNFLRYKYLLKLPREYDELNLNLLLSNKNEKTLNKWTQDYINMIKELSYEKILYNVPLEDAEKEKLWLEFLCFMLSLHLRSLQKFDKSSYNIFSVEYDLQTIANNLVVNSSTLKDPKYYIPFFKTLIGNNLTTKDNNMLKEALLHLSNYINVNKPTLKPSQAIIAILLHIILLNAHRNFGSFENIGIYIKENIPFAKDSVDCLIRQNESLFGILHKGNSNNINTEKSLHNIVLKAKAEKYNITVLPIFKMFYDMRQELFYTYLTQNYTHMRDGVQQGLQDLENALYNVESHEEFIKLSKILYNKRETLTEKYKSIERKRLKKLDNIITLFLKAFSKFMTDSPLNFTEIPKDYKTPHFMVNHEKYIKERNPKFNPKATKGSPQSVPEEFIMIHYTQAYNQYRKTIPKLNYLPGDDFSIYIDMLEIGLSEILFTNDSFATQIFSIIHFSYEYLTLNIEYASIINDHITSYLCAKIYDIFYQYANKITEVYAIEKENNIFSFEDKKELITLLLRQKKNKTKGLFQDIYSFSIFKQENINDRESALKDCFKYFSRKGFAIEEKYLALISEKNSFNKIMTMILHLFNDMIIEDQDYLVNIALLFFFSIYKKCSDRGLDFYPLNTRENMEIILYEILHFEEVTTFQILNPTLNWNIAMHHCFSNKLICSKNAPVIRDMISVLNAIYDRDNTITHFEEMLFITILELASIVVNSIEKVGLDFILLCLIKWLLCDFQKIITIGDRDKVSLEKLTIKNPSLRNSLKIHLDICSILDYIGNLEKILTNHNIDIDLLYNMDCSNDVVRCQEIYAESLGFINTSDNRENFQKEPSEIKNLLKRTNIIQTYDSIEKLNYDLLGKLENIFKNITFFPKTIINSNMVHKITSFIKERKILFGMTRDKDASFSNSINNALLAYIPMPDSGEKFLIFGVVTKSKALTQYYRNQNEQNNPIYIPIEEFDLNIPIDKNNEHRLVILDCFILVEKSSIINIATKDTVYYHLLYNNSKIPLIDKFIINFGSYSYHKKNSFMITQRLTLTLEMLLPYAKSIIENNRKYKLISEEKRSFILSFNHWSENYKKDTQLFTENYEMSQKAFEQNNRISFVTTPELTKKNQLYALLFLLDGNKSNMLSITLKAHENMKVNNNIPNSKLNLILKCFVTIPHRDILDTDLLDTIKRYLYRMEEKVKILEEKIFNETPVIIEKPVEVKNIRITPKRITKHVSSKTAKDIKIISWNVNSIKARKQSFIKFVKDEDPDIILLQEIRCTPKNFPKKIIASLKYNIALNCYKNHQGTAILSKYPFKEISWNLPGEINTETRYLEARVKINDSEICLASIYVPHGEHVGSEKYQKKLCFIKALEKRFKQLEPLKDFLIFGGDYNIDPNKPSEKICCTPEEQDQFSKLLGFGLSNPPIINEKKITYLQLDHFLVSTNKVENISVKSYNRSKQEIRKTGGHTPILCKVKIKNTPIPEGPKSLYIVDENNCSIRRTIL